MDPPHTPVPAWDRQFVHSHGVYEPSEDSFLLIDTLRADLPARLRAKHSRSSRALLGLEVGPGSGVVSCCLAQIMNSVKLQSRTESSSNIDLPRTAGGFVWAMDVSASACRAVQLAAKANDVSHCVDCVQADATRILNSTNYAKGFANRVDVLVFNPPYVPCDAEELAAVRASVLRSAVRINEVEESDKTTDTNKKLRFSPADDDDSSLIDAAWAGGKYGREVLDLLLPYVYDLLTPGGDFYVLAESENRPRELARRLEKAGLHVQTIARRRAVNEDLYILRAQKPFSDVEQS